MVKIKKNGKVVCEIPLSMYPLDVEVPVVKGEVWGEKSYTWLLSYHRDEKTYKKILDKPRGTQLS